jgi:single-stranded-DNA-specific exonuclease
LNQRVNLTIARRTCALPAPSFDQQMHPVLQRVYAARGVRDDTELALSMRQLLPVGTLDAVNAAAELLCQHRERGRPC